MWRLVLLLAACSVRSATFMGAPDATSDALLDVIEVPAGDLHGPITWLGDKTYILRGYVFVTSGILTIEPGATIRGDGNSALVVTTNAKIIAEGAATAPIVFTSNEGTPGAGDWGGIVLLGKALINDPPGGTKLVDGLADVRATYGGIDFMHDCGTLRYVRIEYAGHATPGGARLPALLLGACGSATSVDYVQLHRSAADGLAIIGGNAFLRHLVITQPTDDALDWDLGWFGRIQFLITQQRPGLGDTAIEGDSNPVDPSASPRSMPEIYNMTLVGTNGAATDPQGGIHLGTGTDAMLNNLIVMGFPRFAIDLDGLATVARLPPEQSLLYVRDAFFVKPPSAVSNWPANFDGLPPNGNDGGFDEANYFGSDQRNRIGVPVDLGDPFNLTAPSWKPNPSSPVLGNCTTPSSNGFDAAAVYCGAVGDHDWTAGWTRY